MIKGGTINKADPVLAPVKGANSRLNDGRLIGALDYQVLEGGIDIVREIYQLPLGGFSEIVNLRPPSRTGGLGERVPGTVGTGHLNI